MNKQEFLYKLRDLAIKLKNIENFKLVKCTSNDKSIDMLVISFTNLSIRCKIVDDNLDISNNEELIQEYVDEIKDIINYFTNIKDSECTYYLLSSDASNDISELRSIGMSSIMRKIYL